MSHVDEGTLHAYLDGALPPDDSGRRNLETHIAGCVDCRARLDAERSVRDRATHVLRQMAPDAVRVEPFEAILATRRTRGAAAARTMHAGGRRGWPRFRMPLAAAASVLLAVTATWIVRSNLPSAAPPADSAILDFRADAATVPAAGARASAEADIGSTTAAEPVFRRSSDSIPAAARSDASTEIAEMRDESTTGRLDAARPVPAAPPPVMADQSQRSVEETRRVAGMIGLDQAREGAGAEADLAAKALDPVTDTVAARMIDAATGAAWRLIARETAAGLLGREPATIAGVAVDTIQAAAMADGTLLMRIVQRVDENTVEILQWNERPDQPAAAIMAAPPPRMEALARQANAPVVTTGALERERAAGEVPGERNVTTLSVGGSPIVLRAVVSLDSLTRIGQRVR